MTRIILWFVILKQNMEKGKTYCIWIYGWLGWRVNNWSLISYQLCIKLKCRSQPTPSSCPHITTQSYKMHMLGGKKEVAVPFHCRYHTIKTTVHCTPARPSTLHPPPDPKSNEFITSFGSSSLVIIWHLIPLPQNSFTCSSGSLLAALVFSRIACVVGTIW